MGAEGGDNVLTINRYKQAQLRLCMLYARAGHSLLAQACGVPAVGVRTVDCC